MYMYMYDIDRWTLIKVTCVISSNGQQYIHTNKVHKFCVVRANKKLISAARANPLKSIIIAMHGTHNTLSEDLM
jgi:hypothetical protein